MKTLLQFLESAPKAALTAIHQRALGKKGLLSSSKILQESLDAHLAPLRLEEWLANLEDWQLECLQWIYGSQARGLSQAELVASVSRDNQGPLSLFLLDACEKLFLYRIGSQGSYTYFGFQDFASSFAMPLLSQEAGQNTRWHHHASQLSWHLVRLCSLSLKSQVHLASSGDLHRRSQTAIEEAFVSTAQISESAAADERVLLLEYMTEHGWFLLHNGDLLLSEAAYEGLSQHPGRLRHHLFNWWLLRRMGLTAHEFRKLIAHWPECMELGSLARLFWPLTPSTRIPSIASNSHNWASLPRILRELWLLGFVEFNLEKGRHSLARLSKEGAHWKQHGAWESELQESHPPVATANFEAILATTAPTRFLFTAASIAEILSDDSFLRIQFSKDNLLAALRTGLSQDWLREFIQWCKLPPGVAAAIAEWTAVHCGSSIRTLVHLRIQDPIKWAELSSFPQFLQHTEESIPNWGFIIKPGQDRAIRELLAHFGLEPPEEGTHRNGTTLTQGSWTKEFAHLQPIHGVPDYEWQPAEARSALANALAGQSKYNTDFQTLDYTQTLKVLRYAMVMEVPIEVLLTDPSLPKAKPISDTFQVMRINNRREPYRITAQHTDGSQFEFTIDQIVKLRLTAI